LIRVQNYRQTCCQRQFPNWSQIWACRQDVVPSGDILGGWIGAIEGATGPHIPMQGGRDIEGAAAKGGEGELAAPAE
jgi:hypothetical protein